MRDLPESTDRLDSGTVSDDEERGILLERVRSDERAAVEQIDQLRNG
ncbi:hypothetical protein [Actinoalloteichus hymeniacidonis]|nr:hypothetical protein [Actinoalloteichus hymeniacidonis]MBB5909934.1 hypothetical protein [Actinoalloteichus hymeniacidonis]